MKKYYTINQAAKEIGLPHTALRTMQAQGKLPGFYVRTRYYVNIDALQEMLESSSRNSSGELKNCAN